MLLIIKCVFTDEIPKQQEKFCYNGRVSGTTVFISFSAHHSNNMKGQPVLAMKPGRLTSVSSWAKRLQTEWWVYVCLA